MEFSKRIQSVKPSPTLSLNAKAAELRSQGKDIISLAAGEPDFQPPETVKQAVKEAVDQNYNRYTPVQGIPELLQAVNDYYYHFYQVQTTPQMVIVTNGGKQGLFNLFQILINPEDEVLIPSPYWVSYPEMVRLASGQPVIVSTKAEDSFKLSLESLEKALTPKTKALILNSPSNPTGCHYSQKELDRLIDWAIQKGLFIISDEIYDQLVYPPAEKSSACAWLNEYPENIAIINGLSKSFALTGWRIGFVLSHPEIIKSLSKIQGQSTSNICSLSQKAALAALHSDWTFLNDNRKKYIQRRDRALEIINSWKEVLCPKPEGAFYLFPDLSSYYNQKIQDSNALCTYLLEEAEVALVPGVAFGQEECVRFSYALDEASLLEALNRVDRALKKLKS